MGALARLLRGDPSCGRCGRPCPSGKCRVCKAVQRGHDNASRRSGVNPTPQPCPNSWCNRTMRGGVCPNPDC